jgi:hypothetical protein
MITFDAVANVAGGTLDFQVVETPLVGGEVFQIDDVAAWLVPAGMGGAAASMSGAPATDGTTGAESGEPHTTFGARLAPNPIGLGATLRLVTTRSGAARVRLYDMQGRMVRTLLDQAELPAGRHSFRIEPKSGADRLSPGMYFYRIEAAEGRLGGKFVVTE